MYEYICLKHSKTQKNIDPKISLLFIINDIDNSNIPNRNPLY